MIRSMTGYGRAESSSGDLKITVEMKSVNNRYLDFNIRMPKRFAPFESNIRSTLKEYMQRGKVDVFISYEDLTVGSSDLHYNANLALSYLHYMKKIAADCGLPEDIRLSDIARSPEVLTMEEEQGDEEELWKALEGTLREAAVSFSDARAREGERLRSDVFEKLAEMKEDVSRVEEREPQIVEEYRAKLTEKMKEILADREIDDARIASEVILYADRICTDEETVRLKSHMEAMKKELEKGDGVGRKLDFLAQEMNREANTILSKAGDLETSDIGISLKTGIEKIREQIQNIE